MGGSRSRVRTPLIRSFGSFDVGALEESDLGRAGERATTSSVRVSLFMSRLIAQQAKDPSRTNFNGPVCPWVLRASSRKLGRTPPPERCDQQPSLVQPPPSSDQVRRSYIASCARKRTRF